MKAESVLRIKSLISWLYLFIAISLIVATIFPTFYTGKLCIIHTDYIGTGYAEKSLGISGFFLLVLAFIYIVHFVCGAFYYPGKYREILREKYVEDNNDRDSHDYSFWRGSVVSIAVCVVMYLSIYDVVAKYRGDYVFWGISIAWFAFNALLARITTTVFLFNRSSVLFYPFMLTDWDRSDREKNKENLSSNYEKIFFDYPTNEDEDEWKMMVASAYATALRKEHILEKERRAKAKKLSEAVMESQKF